MDYTINRSEKGKIDVKVTVGQEDFQQIFDDILLEFGAKTQIPGFRPGKAPKNLVEEKVGHARILNEAAGNLASKHLVEIMEKEKISPIVSPNVVFDSLTYGGPFVFSAVLYEKPKVNLGDWKKIEVKKGNPGAVTDKDVEKAVGNIFDLWKKQKESAKQETVADEKVEPPSPEAPASQRKFIYDASGNKLFFDKSLRSSAMPAGLKIDDEFAKAVGAKDLVDLKSFVKRDLERIAKDEAELKIEDEIFEEISKLATVDAPDILIDEEIERLLVRLNNELTRHEKTIQDYIKERNITFEQLREELRIQAGKNIKTTLVLDKIGFDEKVMVPAEELDKLVEAYSKEKLTEEQKADLRRYLFASLFQAKTLAKIKEILKV
jgi:trigger factor